MKVCYGCFKEYDDSLDSCPDCGFSEDEQKSKFPAALPCGTVLAGRYIIGKVLGQGGFGITYFAKDHTAGSLVAVKELYPDMLSSRQGPTDIIPHSGQHEEDFLSVKQTFLQEAENIAKFNGDPGTINIFSYFEENGTAYYAMEYVDGQNFSEYIASHGGRISWEETERILLPVMQSLVNVHSTGMIHRDIKPDNIMITAQGTGKLLDFGSARYSMGEKSRSLDVILTHGFSPKEQYSRHGRQGAYTDVYAMAATFYYAVTGKAPMDSIDRMDDDDIIMPSSIGVKVSADKEDALLKALAVNAQDRFQNMEEFKAALIGTSSAVFTPDHTTTSGEIGAASQSSPTNATYQSPNTSFVSADLVNNTYSTGAAENTAGTQQAGGISVTAKAGNILTEVGNKVKTMPPKKLKVILGVFSAIVVLIIGINVVSNKEQTIEYPNGTYVGHMSKKERNGQGEMTYSDGSKYVGEWKDDERNGKGIMYFSQNDDLNREKYDGEWKNDKRNGKGLMTWTTGSKYEGDIKDDALDGKGIFTWADGSKYEGEFKNDAREGKGIYICKEFTYDGEWKYDKCNGQGTQTWNNGLKYSGIYVDGKVNGEGTIYFTSGRKATGYFSDISVDDNTGDITYSYTNGTFTKYEVDGSIIETG